VIHWLQSTFTNVSLLLCRATFPLWFTTYCWRKWWVYQWCYKCTERQQIGPRVSCVSASTNYTDFTSSFMCYLLCYCNSRCVWMALFWSVSHLLHGCSTPWFICSFWHYINCLFAYLTSFRTFFLIYFLAYFYFLTYLLLWA